MRLSQYVKLMEEEKDFQEGRVLNDIILKTKDQFEGLSEDLKDMISTLQEAIKSNNWKKVKEVENYINKTKQGIDIYVNTLHLIK